MLYAGCGIRAVEFLGNGCKIIVTDTILIAIIVETSFLRLTAFVFNFKLISIKYLIEYFTIKFTVIFTIKYA